MQTSSSPIAFDYVPAFIDYNQSAQYRLIGWTIEPDGLIAHFAGGASIPSVHETEASLLAEYDALNRPRKVRR